MMSKMRLSERKKRLSEEIIQNLKKYKTIGIIRLDRVKAVQINDIRNKLREKAYIRHVRNTFLRKILKDIDDPNLGKLLNYLNGPGLLILTDMHPVRLQQFFWENRMRMKAKSGDIATEDIIVYAGNTGLPPGPAISELNEVGIPTRIETGSIWVTKDTVVARKGDVISTHLAAVLSKLGIKPIEDYLKLRVALYNGTIFDEETIMEMIPDRIIEKLKEAHQKYVALSTHMWIPTKENIQILIWMAHQRAEALKSAVEG